MMNTSKDKNQPKMSERYPLLEINVSYIEKNSHIITTSCQKHNIRVCGIVKGANADPKVANALIRGGCQEIGDARLHHLRDLKEQGIHVPLLLTRIPMLSEIDDLVAHADISLNSELSVIKAIDLAARNQNRHHKVIIMCDLGDLREGFFYSAEVLEAALYIENHMTHVELLGIGTNLGCYGSVEPSVDNLNQLVTIAERIEEEIGRKLKVISGGATSSLPLVFNGTIPERINHLRIGEGILLAKDLEAYWGLDLSHMHQDTFLLKTQLIEVKTKPTHPIGRLFVDAFGQRPQYEDRGIRKRGIVAVGKQDFVYHDKLIPTDPKIRIVGSSSDHLIIDLEDTTTYQVGDIVSFTMFYGPMLYLTGSQSVYKTHTQNMKRAAI